MSISTVQFSTLFPIYAAKASGILDIGDVYQTILTLTTPSLPAGEYTMGVAINAAFNEQKNRPMIWRVTGAMSVSECSDSIGDNDIGEKNRFYAYPKNFAGGVMTLVLEAKKSAAFSAQLDINFADLIIRRIGPERI